jgi:hypothetical protein
MDSGGATVTTAGAAAAAADVDVSAGEHPVPNRATRRRGKTVAGTHRRFEIMKNGDPSLKGELPIGGIAAKKAGRNPPMSAHPTQGNS